MLLSSRNPDIFPLLEKLQLIIWTNQFFDGYLFENSLLCRVELLSKLAFPKKI